jgi:hypothetical protein
MIIDVSKLKKGDLYYNREEGWVGIESVVREGDSFIVADLKGGFLEVRSDGTVVSGDTGWDITVVDFTENVPVAPIKSDGGSSSYYTFPQELFDKIVERGCVEVEDIIKYGFNNDFDFGNSFKSLKRLYELQRGGGKEGNTEQYEVNKIIYSLNKINGNKATK